MKVQAEQIEESNLQSLCRERPVFMRFGVWGGALLLICSASAATAPPKDSKSGLKKAPGKAVMKSHPKSEIHLDLPIRGWRASTGDKIKYEQEVNYPASRVNTEGFKSDSELIRGHIRSSEKFQDPLLLIVNGLDMPLRSDGGKSFSRPFAFGPGSNSVEVRAKSENGKVISHRTQFYEAYAGMTTAKLRILLSWDTDGTDLDLHVVTPDGEHCFYGNRSIPNGGALDVDVTDGYGPEIFSMPAPIPGTYLVYVNYFGSGTNHQDLTTAKVSVVTHAGTPEEKIEQTVVPMRAPGQLTLVKTFQYP